MAPQHRANQSLEKAFQILDFFDEETEKLRLSDISRRMSVSPGSLYPILGTLERHGYLERDENRRYGLGWKFLERSRVITEHLDIRSQAKPYLEGLARDLRANAHLAVLRDWEVLYLDREVAGTEVVFSSIVGHRVPAHCTALGKVLLAGLSPELLEQFLDQASLPAFTDRTIVDAEDLREELGRVAEQGYALDGEESQYGVACVAAPVRAHTGRVMGALSVSVPSDRLGGSEGDTIVHRVRTDALRVSRELGYELDSRDATP